MMPVHGKQILQPLRSAVLKPSSASTSSIALQELKEVCSIHVSHSPERGHKARYAVEVSTSQRSEFATATNSRISTVRSTDSKGSAVHDSLIKTYIPSQERSARLCPPARESV
ncbi:hypothetical protein ON010_g14705 [Phytophthora cinnamomi]|nr:hypothetical protein ON010_g14705 [Phytophthora cinnamomi]